MGLCVSNICVIIMCNNLTIYIYFVKRWDSCLYVKIWINIQIEINKIKHLIVNIYV